MTEFDRAFLIGHGVPEDQADEVLAAHEAAVEAALADAVSLEEAQKQADEAVAAALADAVSREEAKRQVDAAVAEAMEGVDPEAIARLEAERDMLRTIGGEDFECVKSKFREQVYALLERGEGAKPVAEQLATLREAYEEYFISDEKAQRLPRFGGPTRGSMPRGAVGAAEQFRQTWGFGAGR